MSREINKNNNDESHWCKGFLGFQTPFPFSSHFLFRNFRKTLCLYFFNFIPFNILCIIFIFQFNLIAVLKRLLEDRAKGKKNFFSISENFVAKIIWAANKWALIFLYFLALKFFKNSEKIKFLLYFFPIKLKILYKKRGN
ncbi:hypothetical protein Mgra_00008623 [Meloidogyne graminicola]|uniref:Uncharacterized protein n=1 Tax=Meloidogyne graminicola TaxID=189291 RepID=A0A8S9ZF54_9BILA|nr:hypothetical protein Mgra_00008623 [Meloidogyne graminicola]